MAISKTANLVLIPTPGMGHLVPALELATQLVARDPHLSITVLIIKFPTPDDKLESHLISLKSNPSLLNQGIQFVDIPLHHDTPAIKPGSLLLYMESYQSTIKNFLMNTQISGPVPIAGLIVDMFVTPMIDVATELGLPSYVLFTSGAGLLNMMFHLQGLGVDVAREYDLIQKPHTALEIPGFRNPVPVKVWPGIFLNKDGSANFLQQADKYRQAKGILVNTYTELEWDLIHSLSEDNRIPTIYSVGPIINLSPPSNDDHSILKWLDSQPPQSVVFLCFGSRGSFDETQIKEIASGLERSGRPFLWSLRQQPDNKGGLDLPLEFDDVSSVLPEGFLERTREKGRVIGWAPQTRVLAHRSVGAFVSHCGWNSTLESLWYGVPIAVWPIYAEQQLNAFVLVRELGVAAEIRMDYRQDLGIVVQAAEVESGIKKAMEDEQVRKKVEEMSDKARKALLEGGSSYESLGDFIKSVFANLPGLRITFVQITNKNHLGTSKRTRLATTRSTTTPLKSATKNRTRRARAGN